MTSSQLPLEFYKVLVDNALVGIYVLQEGRVQYINPVLERLTGYSCDELRGRPVLDLVVPEDRELVAEQLRLRESGQLDHAHYRFRSQSKDGRIIWYEVFGHRVEWNGRPAIVGTALDITAQKESEQFRDELLAIGTQILQSSDTKAMVREIAQAFAKYSRFERVGVSLYAAPTAPDQSDPPIIAEYITVGLSPEQEQLLRQHRAAGKILSDKQILEAGQPIGPALYVSSERLPQLQQYAVTQSKVSAEWGPYDMLYWLLRSGEQIFGRIALSQPRDGRLPTPAELAPLTLLVNMAILALTNAYQIQALHEQQQKLAEQAHHDSLTGVYNRRAFDEMLTQLMDARTPFTLVFVDIDDFFEVNDRFGHLVGDRVIQALAQFLREIIRKTDSLFRYGGDEFIILMPQTTSEKAEQVLARLQHELQNLSARWAGDLSGLQLSISIGASSWSPENPRPLEAIFEEADQFMYRRKRAKQPNPRPLPDTGRGQGEGSA
ncbi:MAG: diguanylate cyclase [Candidatus Bipolaricaulota bacterium]|nr:diguanylate cyclase [Candidatus Bipolaricaulota bacterium]